MKRFIIPTIIGSSIIVVGLVLGSFLTPTPDTTTYSTRDYQTTEAITQDTGEGAKLVVEGPTRAKAGDLVVISVEKSRASSFKWLVLPSTSNYLVIDEGRSVVFSSGVGGDFKFIVACSLDDTCDVVVHSVTVIGEAASPADNLASKIALWCDEVKSDTMRDDCLALAQSFSSVALVMEGGNLTTPAQIVTATYKSNKDALNSNLDAWLPFRNGLSEELGKMAKAGNLSDTDAHVKVWKAIAATLREYASTIA